MIDLKKVEAYRENNRIEAKRALGGLPYSVWETYSSFANTQGGIILLGVEELEDKRLHALDLLDPQWLIEDFLTILNDPTQVSANILTDEDIDWETMEVDPIDQGDHIINFLLVGKDLVSSGICRTDSIILCTINKSTKQITLTSFMRDLYLRLPNGYNNRINASYVFGGIDLLKRTVEEIFGVKVESVNGALKINVYICVEQDVIVKDVAEKVQANVKEKIQTMTNTAVTKVNVYVSDVKIVASEAAE